VKLLNLAGLAGMAVLAASGVAPSPPPAPAEQPLRVVTTTTDLADLARNVGGDRVEVRSLALGEQDPHFVEARPSLVLELRRADLYAQVGLELEVGWAPLLLDQARNPGIQPGGRGHLDLSAHVEILDVPVTRVTRAQGDIHPFGNPHYWLAPENGRRIAEAFAGRLSELDPEGAAAYQVNLDRFLAQLDQAEAGWRERLAPHRGTPVVAYHASWRYFLEFAGLEVAGLVEPLPGIPPGPRHLAELVGRMNQVGVGLILVEPFYDPRVPATVARRTGARVLTLPSSVGGVPGVGSYFELLDHNVERLVEALES
jgi:zinc/manganese transport system substrate-binding protein